MDGPNVREGKAEVCINKAWGSVCSTQFGREDAAVVCSSADFAIEGKLNISTCSSLRRLIVQIVQASSSALY